MVNDHSADSLELTTDAAFWFEAGDERYTWLNALLPVGQGRTTAGGTIVYELFLLA